LLCRIRRDVIAAIGNLPLTPGINRSLPDCDR
jgi:hypothetical protein